MTAVQAEWIHDVRKVLRDSTTDFFRHKPLIYWTDFLVSVVIAYTAATTFLVSPILSWPQMIAFPLAVFWLYRLGSLVHEVAHLPQDQMQGFKIAWNLVVGVPTLTPSPFFSAHHRDHHSQRIYGTPHDPEYVSNICEPGNGLSIVAYVGKIVLFPLVVFLRFLLAPLTFVHPTIREWTLTRASSLTMNWRYAAQGDFPRPQNYHGDGATLLDPRYDDSDGSCDRINAVDSDAVIVLLGLQRFVA